MPKIALLAVILNLSALGGLAAFSSVLAQETGSSTDAVNPSFDLPTSPLDGLLNEWLGGKDINVKETIQQGMNQAQTGLQQAAGQALGSAQDAAKAEIAKQANQAVQGAKQQTQGYVGKVVAIIKENISGAIEKIKIFFVDLFKKPAATY
ncbi:MAG: hypothetical protein PHT44_03570 [Candidatus Portnoybacteria bacterium]|nr:hypothetical protein [Candidatus Portnoybacteria bacterium]MDD4983093.1 hypothetical protein [Candidatus Portnoybacteria bacterium]